MPRRRLFEESGEQLFGAEGVGVVLDLSGRRPGVARRAEGYAERYRRVGEQVDVAGGVYGGRQAGEVGHARAEAVQQDDERVFLGFVVAVGFHYEVG